MQIQPNNINSNKPNFSAKAISYKRAIGLSERLSGAKSIDIFVHKSSDDDTLNGAKTLYYWLKSQGKKVRICGNKSELSKLYNGAFERYKVKKKIMPPSDLALCIDFNGIDRISQKQLPFLNSNDIMIIDHHQLGDKALISEKSKNINYIDDTAKSSCGILVRFFDALNIKLPKKSLKDLYCGMLSDYKKSGLIQLNFNNDQTIIRNNILKEDKNSEEVLNLLESRLSQKSKNKILKYLKGISTLNKKEKDFAQSLPSRIKLSKDGKLAYIIINFNDKQWAKIGMDNVKTSSIISDMRKNILNSSKTDGIFTTEQKEKLKNTQGAIVFYREDKNKNSNYKMSIHSKNGYAQKLLDYIKTDNPNFPAGGHPDRMGGTLIKPTENEIKNYIQSFLNAAENI